MGEMEHDPVIAVGGKRLDFSNKKTIQSFVTLEVRKIQALNSAQIFALIPKAALDKIKTTDEHPFFQAYSICHEGVSNPRIIGDTARPISWPRRAVKSIKNIITKGVKFFSGHNADNSTEGREVLGEIVADTQTDIDGVLHHVVIAYHSPEVRDRAKAMDICSQEAEWNFIDEAGRLVADTIEKLTGIALSNSAVDKPAFQGAKRLGMVQALSPDGETMPEKVKGATIMTYKELKDKIQELNVHPSHLFSIEEIKKDLAFAPVFTGYDAEVKGLKDQIDAKDKLVKEMEHKTLTSTAKTRLAEVIKGLTLTDKQKLYIEKSFKENLSDISDEGLKKFVDAKLDDYKVSAELFGVAEQKTETKKEGADSSQSEKGDYTKAANNEFLNEDFDTE